MAVVSLECCNICLGPPKIQCKNCIQTWCSQSCQMKDSFVHSFSCGFNNPELDMLAKTLLLLKYANDEQKTLIKDMVSHVDDLTAAECLELTQVTDLYLERNNCELDKIELIELLSKFRRNNFRIFDCDVFDVAEGLFPLSSKINHSCCPNATILFNDRSLVVRATIDIDAGSELTISYVDCLTHFKTRQMKLRERYLFECCCEYCKLKMPILTDGLHLDAILDLKTNRLKENVEHMVTRIFSKYQQEELLDYNSRFKMIAEIGNSILSINLYSQATARMYMAIESKSYPLAISLAKYALFVLLLYYPPFHPMIAVQANILLRLDGPRQFYTLLCAWNTI